MSTTRPFKMLFVVFVDRAGDLCGTLPAVSAVFTASSGCGTQSVCDNPADVIAAAEAAYVVQKESSVAKTINAHRCTVVLTATAARAEIDSFRFALRALYSDSAGVVLVRFSFATV